MPRKLLDSELLAKIIDGSAIPSFVIDKEHRVTHWNVAIEALSGLKREEIVGTDKQWRAFYREERPVMADLIVDEARPEEIEAYYRGKCKKSDLLEGAHEAEDFYHALGKKGRWLHFTASPVRDNDGQIIGAVETVEDITERKNAEEALNESEKSFRALFESAYDAIWVHDLAGNFQQANRAAAELSGYPIETLLKMNVKSFLSQEGRAVAREVKRKLLHNEPLELPYEQTLLRKDGTEAICMVTTNLITRDGQIRGFQNIARNVSQEKRMQENLRYYLKEITRAQEEERKRIARELHDDTAQVLVSISRQLDNFTRKKHGFAPKEVLFLKDMQAQLNRGVHAVHRFIQDLRPSLLDDLGLVPAARSLVKSIQEYDGINASLEVVGPERRFSPEVELLLYRVVQEALNNIRRHAQAPSARVVMDFSQDKIKVTIDDNGRGFELLERIDDFVRSGKLGLAGMQERARLLGGNLQIKSMPGEGTTLTVEIPV